MLKKIPFLFVLLPIFSNIIFATNEPPYESPYKKRKINDQENLDSLQQNIYFYDTTTFPNDDHNGLVNFEGDNIDPYFGNQYITTQTFNYGQNCNINNTNDTIYIFPPMNNIINNYYYTKDVNIQNNLIDNTNDHDKKIKMNYYLKGERILPLIQSVDKFGFTKKKKKCNDNEKNQQNNNEFIKKYCEWNLKITLNQDLIGELQNLGWKNLFLYLFPIRLNEKNDLRYNTFNDLIALDDANKIFQENFIIKQENIVKQGNYIEFKNGEDINVTVGLSCSRCHNNINDGKKNQFQYSLPLYIGVGLIYEKQILDCLVIPVEPLLKFHKNLHMHATYNHIDDNIPQRISFDDNVFNIGSITGETTIRLVSSFTIDSFENNYIVVGYPTIFFIRGKNLNILDKNKFAIISDNYVFQYKVNSFLVGQESNNSNAQLYITILSVQSCNYYYQIPIGSNIPGKIVYINDDGQYEFAKDISILVCQQ